MSDIFEILYPCFHHWVRKDNMGRPMGSIFFISDPHCDDKDMIKNWNYPTGEEVIANINSQYGKNDTLVVMGDICEEDEGASIRFAKYVRMFRPCYKIILIMGNHEHGRTNYMRKITEEYVEGKKPIKEVISEYREKYPDYRINVETYTDSDNSNHYKVIIDNGLFDEVYDGPVAISSKIILSHEKINATDSVHGKHVMFNIHGHDHNGMRNDNFHFNVAYNVRNGKLLNLMDVVKGGKLAHINDIHRVTINGATDRAKKRGYSLKKKV